MTSQLAAAPRPRRNLRLRSLFFFLFPATRRGAGPAVRQFSWCRAGRLGGGACLMVVSPAGDLLITPASRVQLAVAPASTSATSIHSAVNLNLNLTDGRPQRAASPGRRPRPLCAGDLGLARHPGHPGHPRVSALCSRADSWLKRPGRPRGRRHHFR